MGYGCSQDEQTQLYYDPRFFQSTNYVITEYDLFQQNGFLD